jgi:NAD(P)-dependent dehydrogenase (short-subunit alcohol dehydrogenase family)
MAANLSDDQQVHEFSSMVQSILIDRENEERVQQGLQKIDKHDASIKFYPRLDVLINCAGFIVPGDLENTHPEDHDYTMGINLRTPFLMIQTFQDCLIAAQGCIINISCLKGSKPWPGMITYCMSKSGLEMLTKSSAIELARFGVRVNAVSPAMLDTNFLRKGPKLTELEMKSLLQKEEDVNPMKRNIHIEEAC